MKKIPTLFERIYQDHKVVGITPKVTEGMEWVLNGEGIATEKIDGSCCAIIGGELYKRYDAKKGKKAPEGAIPCCEPDPITGHHPHWVKCDPANPADKWFIEADKHTHVMEDGTYEAIGPHFQGNPYNISGDILVPHGIKVIEVERSFEAKDIVIGKSEGSDPRIGWKSVRHVMTWRFGAEDYYLKYHWPQCIGYCDLGEEDEE